MDNATESNQQKQSLFFQFLLLMVFATGMGISFYLIKIGVGSNMGPIWSKVSNYGLKILLMGFSLGTWFKTQSMLEARKNNRNEITDLLHKFTEPMNKYFHIHKKSANRLLIVSSAFIDAFALFLLLYSIFGPSMRPFASLIILMGLRQLCQVFCALPKPPGLIWHNPGFPSLLVTYEVENDFFFSGHTSIVVLGTIELYMINPWLGVAAGAIALFEMVTVIVLRAHYTMDVFTAILAAFCATALAGLIF
jgi:hypothetical protein